MGQSKMDTASSAASGRFMGSSGDANPIDYGHFGGRGQQENSSGAELPLV
jgi:hypothetical protein